MSFSSLLFLLSSIRYLRWLSLTFVRLNCYLLIRSIFLIFLFLFCSGLFFTRINSWLLMSNRQLSRRVERSRYSIWLRVVIRCCYDRIQGIWKGEMKLSRALCMSGMMTIDPLRSTPIKGFILDITGVLYNSMEGTDGIPIQGSAHAVNRLYTESRVRFLSNESTGTVGHVVGKLGRLGYTGIREEDVITPAPTAAEYCKRNGLRPHLLVHPGIRSVFDGLSQEDPNCVLIGDAEHAFTFKTMNTAFRHLMKMKDPLLLSLGCGKFYQRTDGPCIDVGAFAEALKYSSGCRHIVIGKPRGDYFQTALDSMGLTKDEVVMIGDDIVSDVGGAMAFGMRAIQVRTGKWRSDWESHEIKPTFIANDLLSAVKACID